MRVETTYYAFDDTEFYSEEECLSYESRIRQMFDGAIFYDENVKKIEVDPATEGAADEYATAYYIKILNTLKAAGLFSYLEDETGCSFTIEGAFGVGDVLIYDEGSDLWLNLKERINTLQTMLDSVEAQIGND